MDPHPSDQDPSSDPEDQRSRPPATNAGGASSCPPSPDEPAESGTPPIPRRTPGPPIALRRWHVLAAVILLVVTSGVIAAWEGRLWVVRQGSAPVLAEEAADALGALPAVRLRYGYVGMDGHVMSGSFVVSTDRYATGTITDADVGTAVLHAAPAGTAVFGDRDWWARRMPGAVSPYWGRWVNPDTPSMFPVDVPATLAPKALATLVRSIARHGRVTKEIGAVGGRSVVRITSGTWAMLLTARSPRRVVSLEGPVTSGGLHPTEVLNTRSGAGLAEPVREDKGIGYLSLAPSAGNSSDAGTARADASRTFSAGAPTPTGSAAPSAAPTPSGQPASGGPLSMGGLELGHADFSVTSNRSNCYTETCSWTVTVHNNGQVPGGAIVTAAATPGMPATDINLGVIPAGGSKTTPTMSYPNPSQGSPVYIFYSAHVYNVELNGSDKGKYDFLVNHGIVPGRDARISDSDGAYKDILIAFLYDLVQAGVGADAIHDALDTAVDDGMLPELAAYVQAGTRLRGLPAIVDMFHQMSTAQANRQPSGTGPRRELEMIAALLRANPTATVTVPGVVTGNGGRIGSAVLVDSGPNRGAYRMESVNGDVASAINDAVDRLNGAGTGIAAQAPSGYPAEAEISLEPGVGGRYYLDDDAELARDMLAYNRKSLRFCADGSLRLDRLVVINGRGTHEWKGAWLRQHVCR